MTPQTFISRLNWRQVLLHFVAFWFFIHAFQILSYLYDTKLLDTVRQSNGQVTTKILVDSGTNATGITYFLLWTSVSRLIGLLVAFIISLIISFKRHWFWINALIAFILTYILYRFDLLGWIYLKPFFLYLGQKFSNSTVEFLVNGIILLTIGLLIFFLQRSNPFIKNKKLATEQQLQST
jgi:hypothetical protein